MEDLSKRNNLLIRNGHYYFRVKVPKDLLTELGKKEIKKSLGTKDPAEVKTKLAIEILRAEELFSAARRKRAFPVAPLNTSKRKKSVLLPPAQRTDMPPIQLSETDIERIVKLWHSEQEATSAKADDLLRVSQKDFGNILDNLLGDYTYYSSNWEENNAATVQRETRKIFEQNGIDFTALPQEQQNYANLIVKQSLVEQTCSSLSRFGYRVERTQFQLFTKDQLHTLPAESNSRIIPSKKLNLLGKTIENFYAAKRSEDVSEKSLASYKLTFDLMKELFGNDKAIESIQPADCRTFKEKLIQLPSNAKKKYPHLTLLEAIEKCTNDKSGTLSIASVNNNLKNLSAFFNFAFRERLIDFNPASHTAPAKEKRGETKKKRAPFTDSDIQKLFSTPIFTNEKNKVENQNQGSKFWIPLIGLYTGMRLNEICQLFTSDIECIEDIHVIQVRVDNDGKKTVKTSSSIRAVPIHKQLIKLGFLDYVQAIKTKGSTTLFPDLTISAKGSPSDNYSKWFHRYLKASNIKRPNLCFHSFRHRFRDQLREFRIVSETVAKLGGWATREVMDGYGAGVLKILQEELDKTNNIAIPIIINDHSLE